VVELESDQLLDSNCDSLSVLKDYVEEGTLSLIYGSWLLHNVNCEVGLFMS